jgi:hypothetical protein
LHERACAVGVENTFYTFPNAPHVPYAGSQAYMDTTLNFIRDFLLKQLGCNDLDLQPANDWMETANLYATNYCDGSPVDEVCPLSLINVITSENMVVFPNPATDEITVTLHDNASHSVTIKDMMGRIVLENNEVNGPTVINLSNLKSGNYIVVIDNLHTTKLIKN